MLTLSQPTPPPAVEPSTEVLPPPSIADPGRPLTHDEQVDILSDALSRAYFATGLDDVPLTAVATALHVTYVRIFLAGAAKNPTLKAHIMKVLR